MNRDECSCCRRPLSLSVYSKTDVDDLLKSCSLCSRLAGEHVFHPIAQFGLWHVYDDTDHIQPQSECIAGFRARVEMTDEERAEWNPPGDRCRARRRPAGAVPA